MSYLRTILHLAMPWVFPRPQEPRRSSRYNRATPNVGDRPPKDSVYEFSSFMTNQCMLLGLSLHELELLEQWYERHHGPIDRGLSVLERAVRMKRAWVKAGGRYPVTELEILIARPRNARHQDKNSDSR